MAGVRFDVFKGIRPRVSPRLLPPGEAVTAENLRLGSGAFETWHAYEHRRKVSINNLRTLYRMRNGGQPLWFEFDEDVDVARGPVPDDDLERTYYTGLEQPRMTYTTIAAGTAPLPADYRILGIPAPTTAPTVSGDTVPEDVVTGTVTAFSTPNLKADFTIDQNLPNNVNSWYMALTEGGVPSDNGYEPPGTKRTFRFNFPVGLELRVASVVDTDTITVEDANSGDYVAAGVDNTRSGQTWWRTEDTGTTRAGFFRFYLPNGIKLTIANHGLQEGDVIRVTSVATPIGITFTAPANVTTFGGHFFGWESDNGAGDPDTNTWPSAPVSVGADDFYRPGATAYPFVDIWVDNDGESSVNSFDIDGQFSYQLIERDGKDYRDIATDIESRVYVYTFVSELGEEGPPSPASEVVTIPTDGSVVVGGFEAPPSTKRNITNMRIYRANTGNESTEFQFVAEIDSPFSDYTDEVAGIDLGEVLQTTTWEPPPEDLRGLVALPNGVLAGFVGKTLYFSEPHYPHAWPPEYKKAVDYDIIGLGVLPNGVAVLTTGPAYLAAGDHPRSMSLRHFTASQACVSKRSIVSTIDSVIYASPDGLASIGAGGFQLLTEKHFRKKEWQQFVPDSIQAFWHDDKYIGFYRDGGFVFDPKDESVGFTTVDIRIRCGFLDAESDTLFIVPIVYDGAFLFASNNSTHQTNMMSSVDGENWDTIDTGVNEAWQAITYVEQWGRFFAGAGFNVYTSEDGQSWTKVSGDIKANQFAYSPDLDMIVAGGRVADAPGHYGVGYSFDGITWHIKKQSDNKEELPLAEFNGVAWCDRWKRFIMITASKAVYTSFDGINWALTATNIAPAGSLGGGFAWSEELNLLMVTISNKVYISDDFGVTWQLSYDGSLGLPIWAPELGLFVGSRKATAIYVTTSADGFNWSDTNVTALVGSNNILETAKAWSAELGLVAISTNYGRVIVSSDGVNWEVHDSVSGRNWTVATSGKLLSQLYIAEWDGHPLDWMSGTWRSGTAIMPYPLNPAAARVVADEYPVTFRLYDAAGTLRATRTVNSDSVFRLPGGYTTDAISVEISSSSPIRTVQVAESVDELYSG